jgi:mono/diheme cytochrome c family protein
MLCLVTTVCLGVASWAADARAQAPDPYQDLASGKAVFEKTCSVCHGLERPHGKTLDAAGWNAILDRMKTNGAQFDAAGRAKILGWLTTKSTFDTKCSDCHGTDRPLSKSKSREEWKATVQRMAGKKPGHLSDAEQASIAAYLAIVRPPQ